MKVVSTYIDTTFANWYEEVLELSKNVTDEAVPRKTFQTDRHFCPEAVLNHCYVKLYNRWKKFLQRSKEIDLWPSIDYHYMTEESEGKGDYMIQHHYCLGDHQVRISTMFVYITHYTYGSASCKRLGDNCATVPVLRAVQNSYVLGKDKF